MLTAGNTIVIPKPAATGKMQVYRTGPLHLMQTLQTKFLNFYINKQNTDFIHQSLVFPMNF